MISFARLLSLMVLVPVVELALLIQIGRSVGLVPTIVLVVSTGAAGAWLARAEGLRVLYAFQREAMSGRLPGKSLLDGACVLVGGVMLVTPGVLTDLFGLALLLPASRRWIQRRVVAALERRIREGSLRVVTFGAGPAHPARAGFGDGHDTTPGKRGGWRHTPPEDLGGLDPRHGIEVPEEE
jgi:UPF0716 protein FxsA